MISEQQHSGAEIMYGIEHPEQVIEHVSSLMSGNCNANDPAGVGGRLFFLGCVLIVVAAVENFLCHLR